MEMIELSENKKRYFTKSWGSYSFKQPTNSRLAKVDPATKTIVKQLFARKKAGELREYYGGRFKLVDDDSVIIDILEQEEKDLVDFVEKCVIIDPS